MAKVQTIRARIKSVKNINQITKAMEMVAASKLRRAQEATLASRTYALSAREALARLRLLATGTAHPLFAQREVNRRLIILFSSDRGLAGAYNSNIFKILVAVLKQAEASVATQLIVIGQKGGQFVSKLSGELNVIGVYTDWPAQPTVQDITPIASMATQLFSNGEVDEVLLLYTDFVSTIKQSVIARKILPIDPQEFLEQEEALSEGVPESLFEPSPAEVFAYIVPRLVEVQMYQASLEAAASEQAMRMVAMKNASDNAKDLIGDLTLTYNGARQASITQELAEITAGAEAIR